MKGPMVQRNRMEMSMLGLHADMHHCSSNSSCYSRSQQKLPTVKCSGRTLPNTLDKVKPFNGNNPY